jgi:hypothetical protein
MKIMVVRLAVLVILAASMLACGQEPEKTSITESSLKGKYGEYLEAFQAFERRHVDDVNGLLGLGFLYEVYGPPRRPTPPIPARSDISVGRFDPAEYVDAIAEVYKKAVAADPTSRPARAGLARRSVQYYAGVRGTCLDQLDGAVSLSLKWNHDKIYIDRFSWLFVLLGKERWGYLDRDATSKEVHDRLDEETRKVIEFLDESQANDPNNALYNYLKAKVFLVTDDSENAAAELEKASQKPYLNNYEIEASRERSKVLDEIAFPADYAYWLKKRYNSYSDFIAVDALWPKMDSERQTYESKGNIAGAVRMNDIASVMVKHLKEEPKPSGGVRAVGIQGLQEKVENHRRILQEKANQERRDQKER